jgi:hypothetical protein
LRWIDPLGLDPPLYPGFPTTKVKNNPFWLTTQINVREARDISNPWTFRGLVKEGGPWDYKNLPGNTGISWQDFGNYNYGASGAATGLFTLETLLREAGRAQEKRDPKWGCPKGGWPYGDDPRDQYWIMKGWEDYWSGLYGKPIEPGIYGQVIQYWMGVASRYR